MAPEMNSTLAAPTATQPVQPQSRNDALRENVMRNVNRLVRNPLTVVGLVDSLLDMPRLTVFICLLLWLGLTLRKPAPA